MTKTTCVTIKSNRACHDARCATNESKRACCKQDPVWVWERLQWKHPVQTDHKQDPVRIQLMLLSLNKKPHLWVSVSVV